MKKFVIPIATLAFAASAAQAQDTGALPADQDAGQPAATEPALPDAPAADVPPAAPDAVPPAADAGVEADASVDAAGPAPAPAPVPQAGVSAGAVSDAEVQSYAQAAVKVQAIAQNTALDDQAKQQQMASAVTEAGLDPVRFNEITNAINADTALRARVQTALAAHAAAHQG